MLFSNEFPLEFVFLLSTPIPLSVPIPMSTPDYSCMLCVYYSGIEVQWDNQWLFILLHCSHHSFISKELGTTSSSKSSLFCSGKYSAFQIHKEISAGSLISATPPISTAAWAPKIKYKWYLYCWRCQHWYTRNYVQCKISSCLHVHVGLPSLCTGPIWLPSSIWWTGRLHIINRELDTNQRWTQWQRG